MPAPSSSGLKVLLMTDLVGSVALQQRLGAEAYAELKAQHDALFTEVVTNSPSGEVLEQTGDGFFIVFANVKDALRMALALQARIASGDWAHERPQVRIGVHLGEVTPTIDQATGHARYAGINVSLTARIMDLAVGGQILLSGAVYENGESTVRAHPAAPGQPAPTLRWASHGRYEFKGIRERVRIYEVGGEGIAPFKAPSGGAKARRAKTFPPALWIGLAAVLAIAAGGSLFFLGERGGSSSAKPPSSGVTRAATEALTIAVLPFSNFDGSDNASFAAGMHEDILTSLAKLSQLQVISRTSVLGYANTVKNIREIGSELGASHLVEGSIRRAGDRVRVTVQLIEAATDRHVWAENFDRELTDVFAIQSEIATRIATELLERLSPEEVAQLDRIPTTNVEAYDAYNRAREIWRNRGLRADLHSSMIAELEEATLLDPSFAEAWSLLAQIHANAQFNSFTAEAGHLEAARFALRQVQRLAPDSTEAYLAEAYFHYWGQRDFDTALSPLVKARLQSPNDADILMAEAYILRRKGRFGDAVQLLEQASKLDPLNRSLFDDLNTFLSILGDYERSAQQFESGLDRFPGDGSIHRGFALVKFLREPSPVAIEALRTTIEEWPLDMKAIIAGEAFNLATVLGDAQFGFDLCAKAAATPAAPGENRILVDSGLMIFGYLLEKAETPEYAQTVTDSIAQIPSEAIKGAAVVRHIDGIAKRILGEPFDALAVANEVEEANNASDDAFIVASNYFGRIAIWSVADPARATELFIAGPSFPGMLDQTPNVALLVGLMPEFFEIPRVQKALAEQPAWAAFIDSRRADLHSFPPAADAP